MSLRVVQLLSSLRCGVVFLERTVTSLVILLLDARSGMFLFLRVCRRAASQSPGCLFFAVHLRAILYGAPRTPYREPMSLIRNMASYS